MTAPSPTSAGRRNLNRHHHHPKNPLSRRLVLLVLLASRPQGVFASPSLFARAQGQIPAYVFKGGDQEPKPLMRAWRCHGRTHKEMVDKLASAGIVKAPINKQALLSVDRRNYVRDEEFAYDDSPQYLGYGQTISAPHMHAAVLEDLLPPLLKASRDRPTEPLRILDVGCGSGYLTAVFGRMVQPKDRRKPPPPFSASSPVLNEGKVVGIDVVPELVELSRTNMMKEDGDLFDSDTVKVLVRDGWKGYPEGSPYDAIHVGAAAAAFPRELMKQLAVGGVMVIPVGPDGGVQYLYRVERVAGNGEVVGAQGGGGGGSENKGFREDDYEVRRELGVRYVPLVQTAG